MPTKLPKTEPGIPQAAALIPEAHGLPGRNSSLGLSAALGFRRLLAVAAIYWLYVTVSDILYANSLRIGFGEVTPVQLFLPWDARLFQHLLLFPALIGCLWLSLRQGWKPLWRAVPLQVLLATGFAVAAAPALWVGQWLFSEEYVHHVSQPHADSVISFGSLALWLASATSFFFAYAFGLAAINGFSWYQRYRDAELRVTALESDWHAARLAALRMQLSPHTLFNLLNTIHAQIAWDPQLAQSMVIQLADLLRRLLNAGEREFSRLADELQFVRLYLELQTRRFPDRLSIALPDSADIPALWVPSLILQPLVENAVVHGLSGHEGPVIIGIETATEHETLIVRISNTVSPARVVNQDGIGLSNVRERLQVHFGPRGQLRTTLESANRWQAEVRLPVLRDSPLNRSGVAATEGKP
jgi:Histidine kinase